MNHFEKLVDMTINSLNYSNSELNTESQEVHGSFEKYLNFEKSFEKTEKLKDKMHIKNLKSELHSEKYKS